MSGKKYRVYALETSNIHLAIQHSHRYQKEENT
jgi:hypothetical protein